MPFLNFRGVHVDINQDIIRKLPKESGFTSYIQNAYGATLEDLTCTLDQGSSRLIYINRSSVFFHSILDFIESGHLHFTHDICPGTIMEELGFWGYSVSDLAPCCLERVVKEEQEAALMKSLGKQWRDLSSMHQGVTTNQALQGNFETGSSTTEAGSSNSKNVAVHQSEVTQSWLKNVVFNPSSGIMAKVGQIVYYIIVYFYILKRYAAQ